MRESIKAASIVLAAVALLSSAIVMPSLAAIFNEGWKKDYGGLSRLGLGVSFCLVQY